MEFKIGDRVRQKKSSEYYHQSGESEGIIRSIGTWYQVNWDDGLAGHQYLAEHLELVIPELKTSKTKNMSTNTQNQKIIKYIILGVIGFIALAVILSSFTTVDATTRGIVLRLGNVERIMQPGFNWKIPFIERVQKVETTTQKIEVEASASSKDLQIVTTNLAVQFKFQEDNLENLYTEFFSNGRNLTRSKLIDPAIQDAVKATTAKFNAEELITQRAKVKEQIETTLRERLAEGFVTVTNVDIVNFDFSISFNQAIEAKVTAEQNALKAQNDLARVEFEAQQRIEQARAEAEAIRIQAQAINSQGGADFVQLQAIDKWDGVLPTQFVPGSAIPFLNLTQ